MSRDSRIGKKPNNLCKELVLIASIATVPLLANLSIPVHSDTPLFEALRSALNIWLKSDNGEDSVKAIMLRGPTQAIVFVSGEEAIHFLLSAKVIIFSSKYFKTFLISS